MSAGSGHSVALVLLVTLMIVATSHWMISNKRSTGISSTAGGEDDVVASAGWCNGSRVNGQCQPTYGGDLVDSNMLQDDLSDMVVEYFDSDGSGRRVLPEGGKAPIPLTFDSLKARQSICYNQHGMRYTCHIRNKGPHVPPGPKDAIYKRDCFE